jgi:plasmid replication initiation protein
MGQKYLLKKASGTIEINNVLTLEQRKSYNILIAEAKKQRQAEPDKLVFETTFAFLREAIGFTSTNYQYLFDELYKLVKTNVKYNIFNKDRRWIQGGFAILAGFEIEEKTLKVRYSFPSQVVEGVLGAKVYGEIDLQLIKGIQSKHALALYELASDYKNVGIPIMSVFQVKEFFGVEGRYRNIDSFKKKVLDAACEELNTNDIVDFKVVYNMIKSGRTFKDVKFLISEKYKEPKPMGRPKQLTLFKNLVKDDLKELLFLVPQEAQTGPVQKILTEYSEKEGKEYVKKNIEYVNSVKQTVSVKNFAGYLRKALEENYAGKEEVIVTLKDMYEDKFNSFVGKKYKAPNGSLCEITGVIFKNTKITILIKDFTKNVEIMHDIETDFDGAISNIENRLTDSPAFNDN